MRSIMSIFLALIFVLCDGSLLSKEPYDPSEIREMTPSELVTAAAEKESSQLISYTLQSTPLHISFDEKYFNYSSDEWKPVEVPKVQQFDPLDTIMMNAVSSNPNKQVTISLDLPINSSIVVRYYVFLTKNERNPPEFKVLLSSNDGMDRFLKSEEPAGRWMNSSVKLLSETKDRIVFIAKLRDSTNSIGLRFVTLQKAMNASEKSTNETESLDLAATDNNNNTSLPLIDEHDSFTYNSSDNENNVNLIINDTLTSLNSTNSTLEDSRTSFDNISGVNETFTTLSSVLDNGNRASTEAVFATLPLTNPSFESSSDKEIKNSTLHDEIHDSINIYSSSKAHGNYILSTEFSPNSLFNPSSKPISPFDDPFNVEFGVNQTATNVNDTLEVESKGTFHEDHEGSLGIFHFFLVIMLTSTVVFLFIYIRRRRRRRDDELPVFRRSATEHGNPTYLDDDTELDIGFSSSNYRSFK